MPENVIINRVFKHSNRRQRKHRQLAFEHAYAEFQQLGELLLTSVGQCRENLVKVQRAEKKGALANNQGLVFLVEERGEGSFEGLVYLLAYFGMLLSLPGNHAQHYQGHFGSLDLVVTRELHEFVLSIRRHYLIQAKVDRKIQKTWNILSKV